MISVEDLRLIAETRLDDAQVLFRAERLEGAAYLCGYAVELALKARICRTMGWTDFPSTRNDFQAYGTFRTHNLEVLLHLSGIEQDVKTQHIAEWATVAKWDPESRYTPIGFTQQNTVERMLAAAEALLKAL